MFRTGLYFALLQLFFTLSWTVYVIFLPQLAVESGLPRAAVVWILLADQLVFLVADWWMGTRADAVSKVMGRLGLQMALVSLVSALAFLALPLLAPGGNPLVFLAVTLVWTLTSSALRAPPLMLIGKYAKVSDTPAIASLWLFGLGLAGALSPYLTVALRGVDARLPFALAAIAVAVAAWGLVWAERHLAGQGQADGATVSPALPRLGGLPIFLAAMALAGIAFQVHFSLNSAPGYLRHATPADLEWLMPVFWVGFNLCVLPVSLAVTRWGEYRVLMAGAAVGGVAVLAAGLSGTLGVYAAAQFVAGAGWAAVLLAAFGAALALGRSGREGLASGGLFSMLALAAALRIGLVALQLHGEPAVRALLEWLPVAGFVLAALMFAVARRGTRAQPQS